MLCFAVENYEMICLISFHLFQLSGGDIRWAAQKNRMSREKPNQSPGFEVCGELWKWLVFFYFLG